MVLTPQQYEIARTANRLIQLLKRDVPASTAHYAVVNASHSLEILVHGVDTITTADVNAPNATQLERDHYQEAVEWLLNSRYVDQNLQDVFHMLAMGLCTEEEADNETMADGRSVVEAYREHQRTGR